MNGPGPYSRPAGPNPGSGECDLGSGGRKPARESAAPAAGAATLAREAAETLACRSTMGVLAYPAILFTTIFTVPGEGRRLWFVLPWGLLAVLVVGVRLAAMWPFERRYGPDPARWMRHFRAGVYASALIWVVFALEEMNANNSAWPTWMILLMTAGIAAGATTSLCPDPPLLHRFLPLLLGPFLFWGMVQGGSSGRAIAIVVALYLAFIMAQARHNTRSFRQSAADREALREAGRRRDALVNSIDGIVWEAEPESRRFTFVSRRAETILGYPVDRWLAEPSFWKDHIHPADVEHTVSYATAEAAAGRDHTLEYRMLAADGRAVWLQDIVSAKKEEDGVPALRGVMVDVTVHRQASEERNVLADALRTLREAVSITNTDGRIVFVNNAFLGLYGYRRDEILSETIDAVRSARNPPELSAAIAEGTRGGGWHGELWNRRKDGSEFPISLSTSLVRDRGGRTIAQVAVASDITERKRAEDEWKRAKEAAEAASRAKSEFLANLSHEICTPMNGILGMNQLLIETSLDEHQRRYAEVARDSARSLLSVLNDILARVPGPAPPRVPANPRGAEQHPRRAARLLLVEDNRTNQEVALGVLRQLGYGAVDVAGDGRQALEMLEKAEYDLILMDCQMPGMDGYEATRRIRQRSAQVCHQRLPIVAMTAHALAGDRDRCLEAGMDDYLAKPVDPKILAGVLEKWLPAVDGAAGADSPLPKPASAMARLPEPQPGPPAPGAAGQTVELPANLPPALCAPLKGARGPASEQDILQTSVLDRLVEGVVITDAEACIQYVNQSFTRMTGYASEEVLGRNPRLLQSGRHDQAYYQRMWQTIGAGQVWRGEIVDRRKDGTEYTEDVIITPVANSAGEITNYIAVKLDKTRRRAEENAQRILAAIVASSEDGILSHTPEGTITSWNHGAERVYGYRAEEILGRSVSLLVPPDLTHNLWPALQRLEAGQTISQLDCTGFSRDGRRINVSVSSSPIYDTSGRVVSVAVIVRDVTARKRVQDELRESEEQFRTIFADAPVGIARISLDGCFLQANAVLCRILGYSGQELAGMSWPELTHPDDLELSRKLQHELLGGLHSRVELEKRYIRKDGRIIPVRLRISLVRNAQGGPRYFIIHVEDVSESRRAQEALTASEQRYRLLFARNLAGVLRTTAEGRILDCNQTAALILGWGSPAEAVGKSVLDCFDSAGDREQLMKTLAKQKILTNSEWKFQRLGEPVWVLANLSFGDGGEAGEIEMTLIDITGRKRAEEDLREAKEVAERADRAKSAFLANMSHEIRTPMNGILGMIGLLLGGDLDTRQRRRAETVRESAESLLGILNDILDFSKMGAGKLKLEDAPFDLRKMVESVADMLAVKSQEKGVELLCFIEPDVFTQLRGDVSRLRQILVNLGGNAVKFTSTGAVSIRVRLASPGDPVRIRFDVKDTGAGIPRDKAHLLFQPFSQIDSSTARQYGGTGLGLSIVRMLADIMGGEVGFESEEGKGSHFWFTVPLERQSAAQRSRALSLAGWRILVVDNHAASRGLILELLAFWKACGEEAGSAAEAIERLRRAADHPFDAVIADWGTLGAECDRFPFQVRQQDAANTTALVLIVPLNQAADGERWQSLGFAAHVAKPVKQGELGTCLASLLGYGPAPTRPAPAPKPSRTTGDVRARLRLLVVEDNAVNQEVALGILENLGYRADVVADGRAALNALGQKDYDLVLMDCHLPGMDGYEASRLIRRPDTSVRNHDVAIIATTANAMAGDREKCLAAGMNGYIAKPLRPGELEQAIEDWTGGMRAPGPPPVPSPAAAAPATPAVPPAPPIAAAFDREDLLERVMGNQDLAYRIIRGFVEDMPGQIAALAQAVSEGDSKQVRLLAHSIKGAAASVGGTDMRQAAWKLEQEGSSGDLAAAIADLPELSASFERVRPVMERFCGEDSAGR